MKLVHFHEHEAEQLKARLRCLHTPAELEEVRAQRDALHDALESANAKLDVSRHLQAAKVSTLLTV